MRAGGDERIAGMSVLEQNPKMIDGSPDALAHPVVLEPREVPLGGPRAMTVHRTLPQRKRSLIGAWCFVDHYGPDLVAERGGMQVPGHPHIGLQTVTWLFEGEVEHRDSSGVVSVIRPGEVNLMTAGEGIAHSEFSTPSTTRLHGAQLWIALPDATRHGARRFDHYAPPTIAYGGAEALVFLGDWLGEHATPPTDTRILGAEVRIPAGTTWRAPVDAGFEIGVLVDRGDIEIDGIEAVERELVALPAGSTELVIRVSGDADARLLVLGGEPLGEPIVMWWNFVARDHDEIVAARDAWQLQVAEEAATDAGDGRYGRHPDAWHAVLPAPELPTVRLKPRE
jgi:quercetin 2,3-dioxygenase